MDDVKTKIDFDAISTAIATDLTTRFGHSVGAIPEDVNENRHGMYGHLKIEQTFGIFAMVISSARINLRAESLEDGAVWVQVGLSYEHPSGGRNGSNIGTYWLREGVIETFRAA